MWRSCSCPGSSHSRSPSFPERNAATGILHDRDHDVGINDKRGLPPVSPARRAGESRGQRSSVLWPKTFSTSCPSGSSGQAAACTGPVLGRESDRHGDGDQRGPGPVPVIVRTFDRATGRAVGVGYRSRRSRSRPAPMVCLCRRDRRGTARPEVGSVGRWHRPRAVIRSAPGGGGERTTVSASGGAGVSCPGS